MSALPRVLIVDRWSESRRILGDLLRRQGADVIEACRPGDAADLVAARRPDVIVYDVETDEPLQTKTELAEAAGRIDAAVVVVGTLRRCASPLPTDRFVSKPYHYRLLLRRIGECVRS